MATLQIRGLSEAAHRTLKERATLAGQSLSDYVAQQLEEFAALPSVDDFLNRLLSRPGTNPTPSAAEVIREARDCL